MCHTLTREQEMILELVFGTYHRGMGVSCSISSYQIPLSLDSWTILSRKTALIGNLSEPSLNPI